MEKPAGSSLRSPAIFRLDAIRLTRTAAMIDRTLDPAEPDASQPTLSPVEPHLRNSS